MNISRIIRKVNFSFAIKFFVVVIIIICLIPLLITFFENVYIRGILFAALFCAIAHTTISLMSYFYIKSMLEFALYIQDNVIEGAYMYFNFKTKKGFVSKNIHEVTGLNFDSVIDSKYDFYNILSQLKSRPYSEEDSIYKQEKRDKWVKIIEYTDKYSIRVILQDVSDIVCSSNLIRNLEYYDSKTSLLRQNAIVKHIERCLSEEQKSVCICQFEMWTREKKLSLSQSQTLDKAVFETARVLRKYETKNIIPGIRSQNELVIVFEDCEREECIYIITKIFNEIQEQLSSFAVDVDVYCGYCFRSDECSDVQKMIQYTDFAVSDAGHNRFAEPVEFSVKSFDAYKEQYIKVEAFREVIKNNLIDYHLQPIVNAATGTIYAYEALMRPREVNGIKLNPLEMLAIAEDEEMLYSIERATIFNTFEYVFQNQDKFENKKLFVNAIPTCLLTDADYDLLLEKYQPLFEKMVIEVIESDDILRSAVDLLNYRYRKYNANIALDDYGTGYSNESNLIKIQPNYIKIDRSLISGINTDNQKNHLVRNIISFASQHDIKTLAEGVENAEELKTVISLGVDLIQGYYTCKPMQGILLEISKEIQKQIKDFNILCRGYIIKRYEAKNAECIDVVSLSFEGYTEVSVSTADVTICGDIETTVNMRIVVADGCNTCLTFKNINIKGCDGPAVIVGKKSNVVIYLEGSNNISYEGIRVPEDSSVRFEGGGNLSVSCMHNDGVCIGGNYHQSFGWITFEATGSIYAFASGENVIGIGGGAAKQTSSINIVSGSVVSKVKGANIISIGYVSGSAGIELSNSDISVFADGQKVVGIGSLNGNVIFNNSSDIKIQCSGDDCCAVGVLNGGSLKAVFDNGEINATINAKRVTGIGSSGGNVDISVHNGNINVTGSGTKVTCIGDSNGRGQVKLYNGIIKAIADSSEPNTIAVKKGAVIISGGNIITNDIGSISAISPNGTNLCRYMLKGYSEFREVICDGEKKYVYCASASGNDHTIYLYMPENFTSESFDKNILISGNQTRFA